MASGSQVLRQWNALSLNSQRCSEPQRKTAKVQSETAKQARVPFQVTSGKYRFRRAYEHVKAAGKEMTVRQLAESLEVCAQDAETMAVRAIRAGLLKETTHRVFHAV